MRVVIAPDKFAGTLSAVAAAEAMADGWRRHAPGDRLDLVPMSDGGPGFVEVLHTGLGGELVQIRMDGVEPGLGVAYLRVGETAYVEAAQAIGLALLPPAARRPLGLSSTGLGRLIGHAVDHGARRVVVGLGGSATNDGGAGLLAALGATASGGSLVDGPLALAGLESVDLAPARELMRGAELVAASDVDNPLLGMFGATKTFGPQKGLAEDDLLRVDAALQRLAERTDRKLADAKGAGAAGGAGFALLLLGASRVSGVQMVADAVGLSERMRGADLVLTGEGAFDFSSRAGKVPYGVAEAAAAALAPCVVLAGRVDVGAREMRALGIEAAYSLAEAVGEEQALTDPAESLARTAARVARTWSRE